jgi:hypothetical protein
VPDTNVSVLHPKIKLYNLQAGELEDYAGGHSNRCAKHHRVACPTTDAGPASPNARRGNQLP